MMTNCRNVSVNNNSSNNNRSRRRLSTRCEMLAMSVIVEEPANMRDSCLNGQEKHADDINVSNDNVVEELEERTRRATVRDNDHVLAPSAVESMVCTSKSSSKPRPTSTSASTTPSSSDEHHTIDVSQSQSGRTRAKSSSNQMSESRLRHLEALTHFGRDSLSVPLQKGRLSSHARQKCSSRLEPSSSPEEEEEEQYGHRERSYLQNTISQPSNTRLKAISVFQEKTSTTSRGKHRQPSISSCNSPEKLPRSKPPTRLDYSRSTFANDVYDNSEGRGPCHASRSRFERCRSKSSSSVRDIDGKGQMPPFRRPSCPARNDSLSSTFSSEQTLASTIEPTSCQRPSRHVLNASHAKSSSLLHSHAVYSESESYENCRQRRFSSANCPSQRRVTSSPKSLSSANADVQCQLASCVTTPKMSVTPNSKLVSCGKPAKDKLQPSFHSTSSSNDSSCERSTLVLSSRSASSGERPTLLSSAAASSSSSFASAASPRTTVFEFPLRLRHYEGRFWNQRKQTLFYFSLFPPEKMPMRGVVLCLHGHGDHCRRNVSMYERLCREGFGVITYDLLNHGVSDLDQHKTRAHISNFNHLVEDTNDFITFAKRTIYMDALRYWRKRYRRYHGQTCNPDLLPELPLVIAGISFGSLVGLHTMLSGQHTFHAAVWSSPTVGVSWNPVLWAESKLAKPLAAMMPKAKLVPAFQYDLLSRDPNFLRRFKADPLTSMDMMTTRTGHEALQAITRLQDHPQITDPSSAFCAVPTLFLAGSADSISSQQTAIKFFATMGNLDKEFKLFEGLYHLVFEEPEKEDVYRYLVKWLQRRFPDTFHR